MEINVDTRTFCFGAIALEKDKELAFIAADLDILLNDQIIIANYIDKVNTIHFAPNFILKEDDNIHEEISYFEPKEKEIFIQKRVRLDEDIKVVFITALEEFLVELPELEQLIAKIKEVLTIDK